MRSGLEDIGEVLLRSIAQKQALEQQREAQKLERERIRIAQEQLHLAQLQHQQGLAQQADTALAGFMSVRPFLTADTRPPGFELPATTQQAVGALANANVPAQLSLEQFAPKAPAVAATQQAAGSAENTALLRELRTALPQEEFGRVVNVMRLQRMGFDIPAELVSTLLPPNEGQRLERIKTQLANQGVRDVVKSDTDATAVLVRQGLLPGSVGPLFVGAADMLARIVEEEKKARIRQGESTQDRQTRTFEFLLDTTQKLVGSQQGQIMPDGSIQFFGERMSPEDAVTTALETLSRIPGAQFEPVAEIEIAKVRRIAEFQNLINRAHEQGVAEDQIERSIRDALRSDASLTSSERALFLRRLDFRAPDKRDRPRVPRNLPNVSR